ncbi:hypothetical protein AB1J28_18555 [Lysinibacillus irui]|nr:hypothetical protein [Lysinibacillus irui]MEA0561803.1 hypothetical protein [Lysinibacillus irui]
MTEQHTIELETTVNKIIDVYGVLDGLTVVWSKVEKQMRYEG